MPATTTVRWDTGPLDRALLAAVAPSVRAAATNAAMAGKAKMGGKAGAVAKRIDASSISSARGTLVPTGLGWIAESGASPHLIGGGGTRYLRRSYSRTRGATYSIRGKRSKTVNKSFVHLYGNAGKGGVRALPGHSTKSGFAVLSGTVQHPGAPPDPYMMDAGGVFWVRVAYPQFAARTLAAKGFGTFKYGGRAR